jgi:deoxyribose-phosphate aldolase
MPDRVGDAERAIACLDLTDLGEAATEEGARLLCAAAVAPRRVAAVCLWPHFVRTAKEALGRLARDAGAAAGRGRVKVATVANFPSGEEPPAKVRAAIATMLADGADEIDVVIPYRRLIAGKPRSVTSLLRAARAAIEKPIIFKAILETGEYPDEALIREAAKRAIGEGADFLKTSTGKSKISATLPAARLLLEAAKAAGRPVGVKVSGGVRSLAEARAYLALADAIMGPDWAKPSTFRFGASSLRDALLAALQGIKAETGRAAHAY